MAKRIKLTRKQMKQPDEFLSVSEQWWEWAAQNTYYLLAGVAGLLLIFIIIQGSIYMIRNRSSKPEAMLGTAIEIMRAPIIPVTQAPPLGLPHYYGSEPERLEAAAKALAELADRYESSTEGQLALMYLGETWEQMREYPKAGDYYQKFLATAAAKNQPYLKLGATMGLGRSLFEQKKIDEALAKFEEVIQANADFKDAALIAAARAWFVKGDKTKSEALLAQARKEFPDSYNARPAGFLIAYWEKNPPKPGESKPLQVPAAAGLDLNTMPQVGGTPASAPGTTTITIMAPGSTTPAPTLGGTAPNALPVPVPLPPATPTPGAPETTPAPVTPAPVTPAPTAPEVPTGENPAPTPAQP